MVGTPTKTLILVRIGKTCSDTLEIEQRSVMMMDANGRAPKSLLRVLFAGRAFGPGHHGGEFDPKRLAHAQQRVQRWLAFAMLNQADHPLGQTRRFRESGHGQPLSLSLSTYSASNLGAHDLAKSNFCHA